MAKNNPNVLHDAVENYYHYNPDTLMPLMMVVLCALLGVDSRQESVLIWLAVLTAGLVLYALVLRRWLWGGELLWYTLAILLGIAYLLLTALPPMGGIFTDPADVSAMLTIPV